MAHALELLRREFGVVPRGIIHVGASIGQEIPDYKRSGARPIVPIEPLPQPFAKMMKVIGGEPGIFPLRECVSSENGRKVTFHVASNGGRSSSYLAPTGHMRVSPEVTFDPAQAVELTTTTLDTAIRTASERHGFDRLGLDYLGMDTQGSELDILRGAPETLASINFIFTEVSFGTLYAGSASFYELTDFLRQRGFDLYELHMLASGSGDALYVRAAWVEQNLPRFVAEHERAIARRNARISRRFLRAIGLRRK
jgi:FkbM family methyltransferase